MFVRRRSRSNMSDTLYGWLDSNKIDINNKREIIFKNQDKLASLCVPVLYSSACSIALKQKIFDGMVELIENPPIQNNNSILVTNSHAIPLLEMTKVAKLSDVQLAIAIYGRTKGDKNLPGIDDFIKTISSCSADKVILDENQLAIVIQMLFFTITESFIPYTAAQIDAGEKELTKITTAMTLIVPPDIVTICQNLFGLKHTIALVNMCQHRSIPAIANFILTLPEGSLEIFVAALTKLGPYHFYRFNLNEELAHIYKLVQANAKEQLENYVNALKWTLANRVYSPATSAILINLKEDIQHFPKIECEELNIYKDDERELFIARNQKIFDAMIEHVNQYRCSNRLGKN